MESQRFIHDLATEQQIFDPWKESYDKPRQHIKQQRYYFAHEDAGPYGQNYRFSSSHVWMRELDH